MRTLFFSVATAAVIVSSSAFAEDEEMKSFKNDGITYIYSVSQVGSTQIIKGTASPSAGNYVLRVKNGRVSGMVNGKPVEFDVPKTGEATVALR